jgi:hypothetical protein
MDKRPSAGSPPNMIVRSIAFTAATLGRLETLAAEVAGQTGRKASVSAVVRALLRDAHNDPDVAARLAAIIEREQVSEVVWGKPRRGR